MYIACLAGFTVVFLLPCLYNKAKTSIRTITIIALVVVFIAGIYLAYQKQLRLILGYAITGFEMMSEGTNNSVNIRQNQIIWTIESQKHVVFGAGIGKANIEKYGIWLESLYALYYYRYGLIALLIYLGIIMTTAVFAYKIAKKESFSRKISTFYYSLFVFYLITPIGVLSGCSQDTPKVSLLFYGIMGLVHKKYYS
jgi:cbb3-type cytochrome oxidase subunit 3